MEKNERSKIIAPSKEKEDSGSKNQKFKGFKSGWNAKYNTSSKLDEMLLNYKTVGKD